MTTELFRGADYEGFFLSVDGEFDSPEKAPEQGNSYDWSGSLERSKATSINATTGATNTDTTLSFSGGVGMETPSEFSFSGDLIFSNSAEQALTSYGPSLTAGYTFRFKTEQEGQFSPFLKVKLLASNLVYEERFGSETRKKSGTIVTPTVGSNEITKRSIGFNVSGKFVEWLRLKVSFNSYSYSKEITEFTQYLDTQPRAASGLSSTVSGFPKYDYGFEIDFFLGSDWELDLISKRSKVASDNSLSKIDKLMLYYALTESFQLGIGGQRSGSDSTNTVSNEGILSVSYDF